MIASPSQPESPSHKDLYELAVLGRKLDCDRHLRIGFLCADPQIETWAADVVHFVMTAPQLTIAGAVVWNPGKPAAVQGPGGRLFEAYRSRCPLPPMLQPTDLGRLLPTTKVDDREARDHLRSLQLDVLISLDSCLPDGRCDGLAANGVWSTVWDDPDGTIREPKFLWPLLEDQEITSAALVKHQTTFDRASVLQRIDVATVGGFYYTINGTEAPALMRRVIIRCLYDLLMEGAAPARRAQERSLRPVARIPSPARLATHLAKRSAISVVTSRRNEKTYGTWFSAFRVKPELFTHRRERFTPEEFEEMPLRDRHFGCADPFPISFQGQEAILAEEILPNGKGRLVSYARNQEGVWQNPPTIILEAPSHLSYPCVFQHGDECYMIPESSAAQRVELWRATRFPEEWTLDSLYAEGVRLVDTTPIYWDGRWYFFTTATGTDAFGLELFIYHAEALRGPWEAHPLNPVCSDTRAARMAGHFFRRGTQWIRPAQDCTGSYGRAIRLFEVLRLSPTEYEERFIELIDSSWHPLSERTHTLNADESIEAIDGWRRFPR
jgi:hypothetical protein